MCASYLLLIAAVFVNSGVNSVTVEEKLRDDPDLSQFYAMLERSELANITLQLKQVTIFAPTNEAFQSYKSQNDDEYDDKLVLYHMTNLAKTVDKLNLGSSTSLTSELEGNPPLWVTHRRGKHHDDVYINNARLFINRSNFRAKNHKGNDQVLHKIDEVLVPVMSPKSASNPLYNPNAWDFLEQYESLNINPFRVRSFRQRVTQTKKEDIFRTEGGHTFFIPIDEGFKNSRPDSIDSKVIDGHVIPKQVLFTSPAPKDINLETLANGDNMKVFITFSEETHGKSVTVYVKSHNIVGDASHTKGVVMAEIVKANIPVRNGVVHLIHKPLMVVDHTVKQFLEEKEDGPLSKFCQEIADAGDAGKEFMKTIERSHDITLFAPSNAAWDDGNLRNHLRNQDKIREILDMLLVVDSRLYVQTIADNNRNHVYQAPTLDKRKNLYFNVVMDGENKTLTVEGGGVNATVIQSDIAATNGIIHIIDRVLGVPYSTVLDKLKTDPMLNDTYYLGSRSAFNQQLNDTTRKYTYFVPRDKAWLDAKLILPSVIKKLFMDEFNSHAVQLLERHLVISDVPYTMERIKQMTNDSGQTQTYGYHNREVELPSQRDTLNLFVEERPSHTYVIHWRGLKIPVFRPNVECTNGVIHVIDAPFLKEGDIRVSGGATIASMHVLLLLIINWVVA